MPITYGWTLESASQLSEEIGCFNFIHEDFYRSRLNFQNHAGLSHKASIKYSKGPEYVEQLKKELAKIDIITKSA